MYTYKRGCKHDFAVSGEEVIRRKTNGKGE